MRWITRKTIRVNRSATAWLIKRFIDRDATFVFVDPDQVAVEQRKDGARGFDAPGATYPHLDDRGRCSFEMLVEEHCAKDQALVKLARIVHGADIPEDLGTTPESAGLLAIARGFPLVATDDQDTVARSAFLFDSLYAALGGTGSSSSTVPGKLVRKGGLEPPPG